jgi:hypothetical protein
MHSKAGLKQARMNSGRVAGALSNDRNRGSLPARERVRRLYRPDRVQILFVGEAPPASGRFFYLEDSGLYRAIRDTFIAAYPFLPNTGFLDAFRAFGCYLVDLCGQPVDDLPRSARASICFAGEARLARAIRTLRPKVIVTLVRSIRPNVNRAQIAAGWSGLHLELPYPGRWKHHRVEFQRQLVPLLLKTLSQPSRESQIKPRD